MTLVATTGVVTQAVAQVAGENAPAGSEPIPWGMGFPTAVTPVMEKLVAFHDNILVPLPGFSLYEVFS